MTNGVRPRCVLRFNPRAFAHLCAVVATEVIAVPMPFAFRHDFERQVTKNVEFGEYQVTAKVIAYGVLSDCESSDGLVQDAYVP